MVTHSFQPAGTSCSQDSGVAEILRFEESVVIEIYLNRSEDEDVFFVCRRTGSSMFLAHHFGESVN